MSGLVYYSSESENTARFVGKLEIPASRIPISPKDGPLVVDAPFVLIVPSYGSDDGRGSVPKGVIRFLNDERNRKLVRGVIGAGNKNFGVMYCRAAKIVAEKTSTELLYRFELLGTIEDVLNVRTGFNRFWREKQ